MAASAPPQTPVRKALPSPGHTLGRSMPSLRHDACIQEVTRLIPAERAAGGAQLSIRGAQVQTTQQRLRNTCRGPAFIASLVAENRPLPRGHPAFPLHHPKAAGLRPSSARRVSS